MWFSRASVSSCHCSCAARRGRGYDRPGTTAREDRSGSGRVNKRAASDQGDSTIGRRCVMAAIRVKDLLHRYGTGSAAMTSVDHVTFDVGDGEFYTLLG